MGDDMGFIRNLRMNILKRRFIIRNLKKIRY